MSFRIFSFPLLIIFAGLFFFPIVWAEEAYSDVQTLESVKEELFYPNNAVSHIYHANINPSWIRDDLFWYSDNEPDQTEYFLVNASSGEKSLLFDTGKLASSLSASTGKETDSLNLPISSLTVPADLSILIFDAFDTRWRWDPADDSITKVSVPNEVLSGKPSPDGKYIVYPDDYNLYLYTIETGGTKALTTDGTEDYFYGMVSDTLDGYPVTDKRLNEQRSAFLVWSLDSSAIRTYRCDQRAVKPLSLVQNAPENDTIRPILYTYRYAYPGDENVPMYEPYIIHIPSGNVIPVNYEAFPETSFMNADTFVVWNPESDKVYSVFANRGEKTLLLLEEDAESGSAEVIFTETGPTYRESTLLYGDTPNIAALPGDEIIWFSERDGWGHLYRYAINGTLINQITSGEWVVRKLLTYDEAGDYLYFIGSGKEGGNPYYQYLYRIHPDGTKLELLTPEEADHVISLSPSSQYFVDAASRVNLPTVTILRYSDGTEIIPIATGDDSELINAGWNYPEQVSFKARDETTDLYGLIFRPTDFDPAKLYPIVDIVYPGPYNIVTQTVFPSDLSWTSKIFWTCQMLAERGFIVVTMDGLGTAYRSKAFHDVSYGHLSDCGLPDHITGITRLSKSRSYMDISRVGMYGKSAGGFMTGQAMLTYPEFFKIGVAASGNHDSRLYGSFWGEKYQGMPDGDNYNSQITGDKAENLSGKLFLITGELDDNVHPSMTIQLAEDLIKAGKEFDMFVFPNKNHNLNYDPYYLRMVFEYFQDNL